jgi:Amt family ammonium transporter
MNAAICLLCIILIPLAAAGLALIHQGLGRSRSAAHAMLSTLCSLGIAAILFVLVGASWTGFPGGFAHTFHLAGKPIDWLGAEPLFARSLSSGIRGLYPALALAFGLFAVALATLIPISSGSDRWRLASVCSSTALFAAVIFPPFAHWAWGNGWLAQLTPLFGLPAFRDFGGAAVLQIVGGLTALSVAWIILALVGWIGLETAASILFYAAAPTQIVLTVINATLSAGAGCLAAVVTTQIRYRKPDASLSANGWIAGLVAGSAGAGALSPLATLFIALVAGTLVTLLVETLELRLFIDDPGGAISVHLGAGLWGVLAYSFFAPTPSRPALILTQLIAIVTLLGVIFPLIHIAHRLLNKLIPFRVDADGDWQGMDIRELGAGAYPEFVVHADEFVPR